MFGVNSSPFLLDSTIKFHIEQYQEKDPDFVKRFLRLIYVDDVVLEAFSIQEACELYLKSKTRLSKGEFMTFRHKLTRPEKKD